MTPEELEAGRRSLQAKWRQDVPNVAPPVLDAGSWLGREDLDSAWLDRAIAVVVGSAVGDALGAPFEFGPPGSFSDRFPVGTGFNEMAGGGMWEPGEFTDDTQMAVLEAQSFVERQGIDEHDIFSRFVDWMESGPKDIGISTRVVLADPLGWPEAPKRFFDDNPHASAGNGTVMRASFAAGRWAFANRPGTAEVARRLSTVTHGDPAAAEGRALYHMLVWNAVRGHDVLGDLDRIVWQIKEGHRELMVQAIDGSLPSRFGNGSVWGCLADALAAVRSADTFEECMRRACDVGGDVDTVAAVAGGLAGAMFGMDEIPDRWLETLRGSVTGTIYRVGDLTALMEAVLSFSEPEYHPSKDWQPDRTDRRFGYEDFFETRLRARRSRAPLRRF